jgi:NAD-dependent SIR2 family protein deacetylase
MRLFLAIGTSGTVYPAAGFVEIAKANGAKRLLQHLDNCFLLPAAHDRASIRPTLVSIFPVNSLST